MKVATVNVQDVPDHPIPVVIDYVKRVAIYFGVIGFIGFQEINDKSDKEAIRQRFPADRWSHHHFDTPTPIVVRKRGWVVDDEDRIKVFAGEKGFSPNRDIVWVDAHKRRTRKGVRYAVRFANWHNINGAWNGRFPETQERRRQIWKKINDAARECSSEARRKEMHFIGVADHNRTDVEKYLSSQMWVNEHGIDKIMAIPRRGYKVVLIAKGKMRKHQPMDHPPLWASFTFRKSS